MSQNYSLIPLSSTPISGPHVHLSVQWRPPPPTPTVTVDTTFGEAASDSVSMSYSQYILFTEFSGSGSYKGKSRVWAKCACAEIDTSASLKADAIVNNGTAAFAVLALPKAALYLEGVLEGMGGLEAAPAYAQ